MTVPGEPVLRGAKVLLAPTAAQDVGRLRELHGTDEVSYWWGTADPGWPLDDDPDAVPFTVRLDGAIVGFIQYSEENTPDYRHAGIDVFIDPAVHGRGLGLDAVRTLALHLVRDRGHHRLTIDPSAANAAAIRCYTAVGFRPVGVMRQYERVHGAGEWRDGLLMDALAAEIEAAAKTAGAA
jgi:aminoglycoside 6'-N-acetyltransferase